MTMPTSNPSLKPFLFLCLIGFLAFFSSYLRIPVLPLYAASRGAGSAQIGMINGAFMLTAGLLSIPAGLVADRIGRRIPVVFGITAVALSSLLIYQCRLPEQMAAVYVLFGAGLAAFAPAMLSLVADVMPVQRLGRAYGWYTTAIYTAMTIGPACGGFLAGRVGLRSVFLVSGGLSLMVALLALLLLPDGTVRHNRSDPHAIAPALIMLLRNRYFAACLIATIGSCIGFGIFLTFLPLSATSLGLTAYQIGMILAAQAFTNVLCRIPIGMWADRVDQRNIVGGGLLFLGGALALLGQCVQFNAMIGCSIILGIGMALTYTAIGALIAQLVPALQRGLAMGMYNSCIYVGMMTGSLVMGIALQAISYAQGFAVAGCVAFASLVFFFYLSRGKDSRQ